ncbi:MAG: winged helix-turn-helix transcriptional regulator [Candidatus Woesearchaeota archaeon]|nr:winged helix-turn-helix transcriptional regulator [Candidatus Woesearchaeota archaeon]
MDSLDKKILVALMKNARIPLTQLSKKLNASREVITYRINKLIKEKIIIKFITNINTKQLGFSSASVFVSIKTKREEEFKEYLNKCPFIAWTSEFSGAWNFGIEVYGKNNDEIHNRCMIIYDKFKEDIRDHRLTIHRKTQHFYEKYFDAPVESKQKEIHSYKIDEKDKIILKELAEDSRISVVALTEKIKLTAPAIIHRIKQLQQSGYIQKFSIFIDPSKIGVYQYSIFIINKNMDQRTKLIAHLSRHPTVTFIIEYLGDPFLEFGLVLKDPYELRKTLQKIEESFPENRITEVFLIQKEMLSIGPPACIFE